MLESSRGQLNATLNGIGFPDSLATIPTKRKLAALLGHSWGQMIQWHSGNERASDLGPNGRGSSRWPRKPAPPNVE